MPNSAPHVHWTRSTASTSGLLGERLDEEPEALLALGADSRHSERPRDLLRHEDAGLDVRGVGLGVRQTAGRLLDRVELAERAEADAPVLRLLPLRRPFLREQDVARELLGRLEEVLLLEPLDALRPPGRPGLVVGGEAARRLSEEPRDRHVRGRSEPNSEAIEQLRESSDRGGLPLEPLARVALARVAGVDERGAHDRATHLDRLEPRLHELLASGRERLDEPLHAEDRLREVLHEVAGATPRHAKVGEDLEHTDEDRVAPAAGRDLLPPRDLHAIEAEEPALVHPRRPDVRREALRRDPVSLG